MARAKNALSSMAFAATLLVVPVAQFGIIEIVKKYTGWTMPKLLAIFIAGLGIFSAVYLVIKTYGLALTTPVIEVLVTYSSPTK